MFFTAPTSIPVVAPLIENAVTPTNFTRWGSRLEVRALMESGLTEVEALTQYLAALKSTMEASVSVLTESASGYATMRAQEQTYTYQTKRLHSLQEHIGTMVPQYEGNEDVAEPWGMSRREQVAIDYESAMVDFFLVDNLTPAEEKALFEQIMLLSDEYEEEASMLLESKTMDKLNSVALAGDKAARKGSLALRKSGRQIRRVKTTASKIPAHFDRMVDGTFGALRRMDENERKRRILEGTLRFKLYRIIRDSILIGVGGAVAPGLTAIAMLVSLIKNKSLDAKARDKLIHELEVELRVVKEKIKDADNKGDNKKKYQLMRIENRIETDVQRIKFNLKKKERNNTTMTKHINS